MSRPHLLSRRPLFSSRLVSLLQLPRRDRFRDAPVAKMPSNCGSAEDVRTAAQADGRTIDGAEIDPGSERGQRVRESSCSLLSADHLRSAPILPKASTAVLMQDTPGDSDETLESFDTGAGLSSGLAQLQINHPNIKPKQQMARLRAASETPVCGKALSPCLSLDFGEDQGSEAEVDSK
ncbi:hypothetical protein M427DRAFT_32527 [Gonapodya prolifera JEL478]|uniref:Uncharacterized protein n=1 Tax=Gonapodya prolifera (strain JEL478) TaxID=1344416 RepID=A0A139AES6_GONPJ|nr:hypothetical protein M427DRAFT_32527 [Gonapodya prolifera JEL478]|eukprot:KXS15322.1 hypothetical protein M427DRAFT_32527 [Gonapodya prolifera JEL478]